MTKPLFSITAHLDNGDIDRTLISASDEAEARRIYGETSNEYIVSITELDNPRGIEIIRAGADEYSPLHVLKVPGWPGIGPGRLVNVPE